MYKNKLYQNRLYIVNTYKNDFKLNEFMTNILGVSKVFHTELTNSMDATAQMIALNPDRY